VFSRVQMDTPADVYDWSFTASGLQPDGSIGAYMESCVHVADARCRGPRIVVLDGQGCP
jgi:hypothetical protein